MWSRQMVQLLRQLISGLSDTIEVWDQFRGREIGYFLENDSPSLKPSMAAIDRIYAELGGLLSKLQRLERELCQDSPQGVSRLIIFITTLKGDALSVRRVQRLINTAQCSP